MKHLTPLLFLFLAPSLAFSAPPVLNYFYPAGVQQGKSVQVTAGGTFATWPAKAWVNREGITVEFEKDKGKLKITAAADASAGVYWIRLYDNEGATTQRPFVVGTINEQLEVEPNNETSKAQKLEQATVVNGRLQSGGDVDVFSISAKKGQTLVAAMNANRVLGSPMDGSLQICTHDGFVLRQVDDERGIDPLIAFNVPKDGDYLVRTFAFPTKPNSSIAFAGGDTFVYRLTITTGAFVDRAMPMSLTPDTSNQIQLAGWNLPASATSFAITPSSEKEQELFQPNVAEHLCLPIGSQRAVVATPTCSADAPQTIEIPAVISGKIESPADSDVFQFAAKKGQKLSFRVESRTLGYPLDAFMSLTDEAGKVLKEVDDPTRGKYDPVISQTIAADGNYRLAIRDLHGFGGERYVYRLTIDEQRPDYTMTVTADAFVGTAEKPFEVEIAIARLNGMADEIEISAEPLPMGVQCEKIVCPIKGDKAKRLRLKFTSTELKQGTFQIIGRVKEKDELTRRATFALPPPNTSTTDFFLTMPGKE